MINIICYVLLLAASFVLELNSFSICSSMIIATLAVVIVSFFCFSFMNSFKNICQLLIVFAALAVILNDISVTYGIVMIFLVMNIHTYAGIAYGLIAIIIYSFSNNLYNTELYIIMCLFSVIIKLMSERLIRLNEQILMIRDDSKEKQLMIEEKGRMLRENQDAGIHLATLKERNRIAREIHDNVGHLITRSIVQMGAVKTINKDTNLVPLLDGVHDTLNNAMNNIRSSVHDLHDESIDMKSSVMEIFETASGFATELVYDMGSNVPKSIKYSFISIIREAVNNTVKHSNGDSLKVVIREHPGFYQLIINDNGTNSSVDVTGGIGLINIRDRVRELGGSIRINCDNGFEIMITIIKGAVNYD